MAFRQIRSNAQRSQLCCKNRSIAAKTTTPPISGRPQMSVISSSLQKSTSSQQIRFINNHLPARRSPSTLTLTKQPTRICNRLVPVRVAAPSSFALQRRSAGEKFQNKFKMMSQYHLNSRYYDRYHTRNLKYSYDMLGDMKAGVNSGAWRRPQYLDGMMKHPPLQNTPSYRWKREHLPVFEYAEDVLREKYIERNPDILLHPLTNFAEDNRWFKHPIDLFVDRQLHYINIGYTQEDAYRMTEAHFQEEALEEDKEVELACEQARMMGAYEREVPWGYEQLSVSFRDNMAKTYEAFVRENREELERMVSRKREDNDESPFTEDEIQYFTTAQVQNYLKKYPHDEHYFPQNSFAKKNSKEPNDYMDTVTWKSLFPTSQLEWNTHIDTQPVDEWPMMDDDRQAARDKPDFFSSSGAEVANPDSFQGSQYDEGSGFAQGRGKTTSPVLDSVLKSLTQKYEGSRTDVTHKSQNQEIDQAIRPPDAGKPQISSSNDAIKELLRKLKNSNTPPKNN